MASKYAPLGAYLKSRGTTEVPMSFSDIEAVIGAPLPPKAVNHPAWWSNNTSNNTMTQIWLDAGFRTERVDIGARRLTFRRVAHAPPPAREAERSAAVVPVPTRAQAAATPVTVTTGGLLDRLRSVLRGTVRVTPGVDLAAPTGQRWDAEES